MTPFRASPGFIQTWRHFDFAVEAGVATLTLSRPDRLNSLTFDAYADLRLARGKRSSDPERRRSAPIDRDRGPPCSRRDPSAPRSRGSPGTTSRDLLGSDDSRRSSRST
jgi:hypothetical protein